MLPDKSNTDKQQACDGPASDMEEVDTMDFHVHIAETYLRGREYRFESSIKMITVFLGHVDIHRSLEKLNEVKRLAETPFVAKARKVKATK